MLESIGKYFFHTAKNLKCSIGGWLYIVMDNCSFCQQIVRKVFLFGQNINLIIVLHFVGLISAKIVPSPLIRYARENQDTRLECHNVSQSNEFYNFAKNVKWYRLVNGVRHNIRPSNRVYASSHVLFFDPFMSEFDQGQYECCVPQQDCSGPATMTLIGKA